MSTGWLAMARAGLLWRLIRLLPIALASMTVTLLAIEIGIRTFWPVQRVYMDSASGETAFVKDGWLGWRMKPHFEGIMRSREFDVPYRTNAQGFRDRDLSGTKRAGVTRILVFGDSQVFGYGVPAESTFPKVLEALLNGPGACAQFETMNLGVNGYGTTQEYLLLEKFAEYRPDLVLVGFFAEDRWIEVGPEVQANDLSNNLAFPSPFVRDHAPDRGTSRRVVPALVRLERYLRAHSAAYELFATRAGIALRMYFGPLRTANPGRLAEAWAVTAETLRAMRRRAAGLGARLAVVYIPYATDAARLDRSVESRLERLASGDGFLFINLLDGLARASRTPYFSVDGHLNAVGHEIAAKVIYAQLVAGLPLQRSCRGPG